MIKSSIIFKRGFMKRILLLIIVLFVFSGCYPYQSGSGGCGNLVQCESDDECVEKHGEYYVCFDRYKQYETQNESLMSTDNIVIDIQSKNSCAVPSITCVEDRCKSENIDCGIGQCELAYYGEPLCVCDEGAYLKEISSAMSTCVEGFTCEDSSECEALYKTVNHKQFYLANCLTSGKCEESCNENKDCKSKDEMCSDNQCRNLEFFSCYNGYPNVYKNGACEDYCNENKVCDSGFRCNDEEKCVPICTSNDDCLKDKFTGNFCSIELNYCVEE